MFLSSPFDPRNASSDTHSDQLQILIVLKIMKTLMGNRANGSPGHACRGGHAIILSPLRDLSRAGDTQALLMVPQNVLSPKSGRKMGIRNEAEIRINTDLYIFPGAMTECCLLEIKDKGIKVEIGLHVSMLFVLISF